MDEVLDFAKEVAAKNLSPETLASVSRGLEQARNGQFVTPPTVSKEDMDDLGIDFWANETPQQTGPKNAVWHSKPLEVVEEYHG